MTALAEWPGQITPTALPHVPTRRPIDPAGGVRTTAQLRTARHADDRRPMLNQYIRGVKVGSGQHGEVLLCYDVTNNRQEVVRACSCHICHCINIRSTTLRLQQNLLFLGHQSSQTPQSSRGEVVFDEEKEPAIHTAHAANRTPWYYGTQN
jgi:hypothetical protein